MRTVFKRNEKQFLEHGREPSYKYYQLFSKYLNPDEAPTIPCAGVADIPVVVDIPSDIPVVADILVVADIPVVVVEEDAVEFIAKLTMNKDARKDDKLKTNLKNEKKWEEDEETRVIDFFCQNNCLWNPKHVNYYKRSRSSLLDIIVEELNFKFTGNYIVAFFKYIICAVHST